MTGPRRFLASLRIILFTALIFLSFEALHLNLQPHLRAGIIVNPSLLKLSSAKAYALKATDLPFNAIVGNSSGVDGFSISSLKNQTGEPWANFSIRGGSYRTLESLTDPLVRCGAKLKVCVVPMHPMILAAQKRQAYGEEARSKIEFQLEALAFELQGESYHGDIQVDPEEEHAGVEGCGTRHTRNHQLNGWKERGMLSSESFTTESSEYRAAEDLLVRLSAISERVVVVKMPEEIAVQRRVPDSAQDMFRKVTEGYQVLDLEDFLEPNEFADGVHPNELGRSKISKALAELLSEGS